MSDKINLDTQSDRELLILSVTQGNAHEKKLDKLDRSINGNGGMGIKLKINILWYGLAILLPLFSLLLVIYKVYQAYKGLIV